MRLRSLTPNAYTWVRVLRLCVSQKKSRRATQVLLDWSASARAGEVRREERRALGAKGAISE